MENPCRLLVSGFNLLDIMLIIGVKITEVEVALQRTYRQVETITSGAIH